MFRVARIVADLPLTTTCEDGKVNASVVERRRALVAAKAPSKRYDGDDMRFILTTNFPLYLELQVKLYRTFLWLALLLFGFWRLEPRDVSRQFPGGVPDMRNPLLYSLNASRPVFGAPATFCSHFSCSSLVMSEA